MWGGKIYKEAMDKLRNRRQIKTTAGLRITVDIHHGAAATLEPYATSEPGAETFPGDVNFSTGEDF